MTEVTERLQSRNFKYKLFVVDVDVQTMDIDKKLNICRLCLKSSDDIVNIWNSFQDSTIASILSKHFWFEVSCFHL